MIGWTAEQVAAAAGAELVRPPAGPGGPARAVIDSRAAGPGDLFAGLRGERADGGAFAGAALAGGAWGALLGPGHEPSGGEGAVLVAEDPLAALQRLARAWRRELAADVVAVTGSVGKTSTKDLIAAMIAPRRAVAASRANFNTEIGLPLELLAAPAGTEVVVLELAMRGFGQIAELAAICEPDVGVITNVGPVHLEQVGTLDGVARAKGELLGGLREGGEAILPAGESRLDRWLAPGSAVTRFGAGGDVDWAGDGVVVARGERLALELPSSARHHRLNALAAVAAALAVGVRPGGRVDVRAAALRGERIELGLGATVINDCYNASPLAMAAALEELAGRPGAGRRLAVLGDMLELGAEERAYHRAAGEQAAAAGVEVLVAVGRLADELLAGYGDAGERHAVPDAAAAATLTGELIRPGDVVLVKGSRGVGLEVVAEALVAAEASGAGRGSARSGATGGAPSSHPPGAVR